MGQTQFRSDDTVKWWLGFGDGSDGDYSSSGNATDAPVDSSCSGTAGTKSLTATNASFAAGKPVLIHQTRGTGAGNWELNQIDSYVAGTITLKQNLQNTYTDSGDSQAQVIQLKQYNNFTQNSGHTLTAKAWDGNVGGIIAFLAKGTVTIEGTISLSGKGARGGATTPSSSASYQGESYNAVGVQSQSANYGGGGGGNKWAPGGGGGFLAGTQGGYDTGTKPATPASPGAGSLVTQFYYGSGGGGGSGDSGVSAGAAGGGICLIICNALVVTGSLTVRGANSANATYRAGGAGSGGAILLKAKTATLGTNLVLSTGGTGGTAEGSGGDGGVGRIHLDYSVSYTGTTTPTLDATLDPTITGGSSASFFMFM